MMEVTTSGPVVIVLSQVRFTLFPPALVQWLTDSARYALFQRSSRRIQLRAQVPPAEGGRTRLSRAQP